MDLENITWKLGGPAGFGIMSTGLIFSRVFSKKGYHVIDDTGYPSLIQGGHNTYSTRISRNEIFSIISSVNVLVALDKLTAQLHQDEIVKNGFVIYDEEDFQLHDLGGKRTDLNFLNLPMQKITREIGAPRIMRNNVALGASMALLNYDILNLYQEIKNIFKKKDPEIAKLNISAAESGYKYLKNKMDELNITGYSVIVEKKGPKMLLTGNDGIFLGAVKAGCKFYAAYPMTPASSLLHSFASVEKDYEIVTKHAESEIAVINMAVGASFAGVRSMVATSGGGFSLMNEGLSAAAMTETPIVIILAQRPAPATGLPTWTEQGDLLFAVHASHGEFLRVVMAPGDPEECFYMTGQAFNLADKYQVPVIIMLDKYLSEGHFTLENLNQDRIKIDRGKLISDSHLLNKYYLRYKKVDDGISPRVILGTENGVHIANTDEHDEYGYSEEDEDNRTEMMDKRFKKIEKLIQEIPGPGVYGPEDAKIVLWSWGSCKGPILEAMKLLNMEKDKVKLVHLSYLYPLRAEKVKEYYKEDNANIVVENNKTSQLAKLIRMFTGIEIREKILKYGGRQILPEEIVCGINRYKANRDIYD